LRQSRRPLRGIALLSALLACGLYWAALPSFVPPSSVSSGVDRRAALGLLAAGAAVGAPAASTAAGPRLWSGKYLDNKHPGCERQILKEGEDQYSIVGTSSVIKGQKECKKGDKVKRWGITGVVDNVNSPNIMTVDFSPKGGPTDVKVTKGSDFIEFPDGNRWKKITGRWVQQQSEGLTGDAPVENRRR